MNLHEIYVPRTMYGELKLPSVELEGIVTVERFRGKVCTGIWKFKNLITNVGLDAMRPYDGTRLDQILVWMGVGTGSTAPAATDTALVAELTPLTTHRTQGNGGFSDSRGFGPSFSYGWAKRVRLFLEAQANGNLTEFGWFQTQTGGPMFSRMLFKDEFGVPTTIVKTAADQLRVTYEIRIYPPADDSLGTLLISGTNHNTIVRPANVDDTLAWLPLPFGFSSSTGGFGNTIHRAAAVETNVMANRENELGGTQEIINVGSPPGTQGITPAAYTNGTFVRDSELRWDPGVANFATGIGGILLAGGFTNPGNGFLFQSTFTPKVMKTDTFRFFLNVQYSWMRRP